MRPVVQLPEPSRLWVRFSPRIWPAAPGLWTHLGRLGLGKGGQSGGAPPTAPDLRLPPLDDVLYLPPVAQELTAYRNEIAAAHGERGTPVLAQVLPGEEALTGTAVTVYDLLASLLAGQPEILADLPPGSVAVWPLLAGLTDGTKTLERGLSAAARAGVAVVQAVSLDLEPSEKRRLATSLGGGAFHGLFHRPRAREGKVDRAAAARGLEPFLPRPLPSPPQFGAGNRRLAGLLALAGELWQRLERPPARGQRLFRAARWVDDTRHDLEAMVQGGNLGIVSELEGEPRRLVEEAVQEGRSSLLEKLRTAYLTHPEEAQGEMK